METKITIETNKYKLKEKLITNLNKFYSEIEKEKNKDKKDE